MTSRLEVVQRIEKTRDPGTRHLPSLLNDSLFTNLVVDFLSIVGLFEGITITGNNRLFYT